jgi:hypothetical protein
MPADPAQLLVWTDVDPAHEADFNRWYDREHMQERIRIPGFRRAARYRAVGAQRRYLALYRTAGLDVFRTEAYRQAFANQTPWSLRNFARMRDPLRRVGPVTLRAGGDSIGNGGCLALLPFMPGGDTAAGAVDARREAIRANVLPSLLALDGVVAAHLMETDPALSTPIAIGEEDGAALPPPPAEWFLVVESTDLDALHEAGRAAVTALDLQAGDLATFRLLWSIDSGGESGIGV